MKPYRILAAVMTALLISGNATATVQEQQRKDERSRLKLKEQNRMLQEMVDSLQLELERCKSELQYTDSIAGEMMAVYEENQVKSGVGLDPEDYTVEVSDSLLNIWYTHKVASDDDTEVYDMDSVRFSSNVPDEVYIERLEKMNSFISLPYNDIVKNYIILYSEKMPTKMSHILGLCKYYMPIFEETFNKYGIPEELKAMAIIESALNPRAVSRVNAKGMWQFMYSTAKMYGLHIDSFVDERFDPVKSADAAARYLKDAYEIFGDWNLAIASYNCGAGNVNKAIRRSGGKRGFWDIWPYLPRETRGYGPAFVGALYTITYYKEHGIKPEAVEIPLHIDTLKITRQLHLRQVSELTGAGIEELKNLNPQYMHEIIPGNREYILRIPYAYTNAFIEHEDSIYRHKTDVYFNPAAIKKIQDGADGERITYKVKSGDTLGKIAGRYRCTVAQIKRWNNLKSTNIRVGQRLVIYRGGNSSGSSVSSSGVSSSQSSSASTSSGTSTYTVKSGDTLSGIAAKHGVTVANIKSWNGLTSNNIKVGQKLKVKASSVSQQSSQSGNGNYTTYTVKSGDSFYSIAQKYPGISAQNIMDFNGMSSSALKPGMKIKIPSK